MNELFCTKCNKVLGTVETANFAIDFYRQTMRCDDNHTDDVQVEIDGATITTQVGSIDYKAISNQ